MALLGRIKGEKGEKYHLMSLREETQSGLQQRLWIWRALEALEKRGIMRGPLFQMPTGNPIRFGIMEPKFIERVEAVQMSRPDLRSDQVEVTEAYGIRMSLRRGSTTEAGNKGVLPEVIDANNWRRIENAGTRQASMSMREHYTDMRISLNKLLIYSTAL
jgi:hypothetical protein